MATVTISSKGQIAIPAQMRRELNLTRSTRLDVRLERDRLVLTPVHEDSWRGLRGQLKGGGLAAALEAEHWRDRDR
jgi:AbrB family looped-hinge helix DNA binding protein